MDNQNNPYSNERENSTKNELKWSFCPVCGKDIPKVETSEFCLKCSTDLQNLKKHIGSSSTTLNSSKPSSLYTQSSSQGFSYGPEKISDEDITNIKKHKLWGIPVTLGLPLGAYLLMNLVLALILFTISTNVDKLKEIVLNPYFVILSSLTSLIFMILPLIYAGKYLQNPTLKNRLGLFGFTVKGFDKKKIKREILLGIGFAIIGFFLVNSIGTLTKLLLELSFGLEVVRDSTGFMSESEIIIYSADVLSLIIWVIVIFLVIGTSEELLFRGFVQKGLVRTLGTKKGIIITALIFSLIHLIGLYLIANPLNLLVAFILNFFPYMAISLMLGLLYYWRKENLITVMVTHGVYNGLSIIIVYLLFAVF